jgi:hypothetical protein
MCVAARDADLVRLDEDLGLAYAGRRLEPVGGQFDQESPSGSVK